jgi:hypothetical protein
MKMKGSVTTSLTRVILRESGPQAEIETLKTIVMVSGVGLLMSLLFIIYGIDLSAELL